MVKLRKALYRQQQVVTKRITESHSKGSPDIKISATRLQEFSETECRPTRWNKQESFINLCSSSKSCCNNFGKYAQPIEKVNYIPCFISSKINLIWLQSSLRISLSSLYITLCLLQYTVAGYNKRWIMVEDTNYLINKLSRKALQLLQGIKGTQLIIARVYKYNIQLLANFKFSCKLFLPLSFLSNNYDTLIGYQ